MIPMVQVYLDLDGVLVDFPSGSSAIFGMPVGEMLLRGPRGKWPFFEPALGVSEKEYWAKIDAIGERYWVEQPPYAWARDLYQFCSGLAPTTILTSISPSGDPASLSGKVRWLYRVFGASFRNFLIVGAEKSSLAHIGAILVDDLDKNVAEFMERGGCGVVFPQLWNSMHAEKNPVMAVQQAIRVAVSYWYSSGVVKAEGGNFNA